MKANALENQSLVNLAEELAMRRQQKSTGELILSSGGIQWHIYLLFGRLLYATGGTYRVRRWHRAVTQYCCGFKPNAYQPLEFEPWEYHLLKQGLDRNQLSWTQARRVIGSSLHEVLFALFSRSDLSGCWLPRKLHPIALLDLQELLSPAQYLWEQWQEMGLEHVCPDQAPVLQHIDNKDGEWGVGGIRSPLIDGTYSMWDIALQVKQPVTAVASALLPLIKQGVIELQTIPDLPTPGETALLGNLLEQVGSLNQASPSPSSWEVSR